MVAVHDVTQLHQNRPSPPEPNLTSELTPHGAFTATAPHRYTVLPNSPCCLNVILPYCSASLLHYVSWSHCSISLTTQLSPASLPLPHYHTVSLPHCASLCLTRLERICSLGWKVSTELLLITSLSFSNRRCTSSVDSSGRLAPHNMREHSTPHDNTTQHSTTQQHQHHPTKHHTTQHSTRESIAPYMTALNTAPHSTAQYNTTQHSTTPHSTAQHSMRAHSTIHDTT